MIVQRKKRETKDGGNKKGVAGVEVQNHGRTRDA